ncbi:MAG: cation-translocating P-type ATPase [Clostridia bacterium]|nr:cation-translocating P-type ATPase [Clostridia bacterium]
MNWHIESVSSTEKGLLTDINNGLSGEEVRRRQIKYGENRLRDEPRKSFLSLFIEQFKDTMLVIVLAAAVVSAIVAVNAPEVGNWQETLVVIFLLIIRALVYALCDWLSARSERRLAGLSTQYAKVVRDGKQQIIPSYELTVGDIVLLEAGDVVLADARLAECSSMTCDERAVSCGEVSAIKDADARMDVTAPMSERVNMVYSGCPVLTGRGKAIVTSVGKMTELGRTASLIVNEKSETAPGRAKLELILKRFGVCTMIVCAVIALFGFFCRYDHDLKAIEVIMTVAALAVTVLPGGLESIISALLTEGRIRTLKKGAFVAGDAAIEELERISVICSDKTGTLTKSSMTLTKAWTKGGKLCVVDGERIDKQMTQLLSYAALCSNFKASGGSQEAGQSTEKAIVSALLQYDMKKTHLDMKYPRIAELPFDRGTRLMTTVHRMGDRLIAITKGAPDVLLPLCADCDAEQVAAVGEQMGGEGLRVIAVACRELNCAEADLPSDEAMLSETVERDLVFLGLLGITNPPREDIRRAVEECIDAGIRVVMVTAEDETAARAVSAEMGILRDGDEVMTGEALSRMSDEELLFNLRKYSVYAHMDAAGKQRIVDAWMQSDERIAVTGDGVGDAPVLKAAHLGFAMGRSGVNMARTAADITVADDSFMTIYDTIAEGRTICDNIRKAIRTMLTIGASEIILMLIVALISGTVPLLSVQLLMLALITGIVPMLSFVREKSDGNVLERKPRRSDDGFFTKKMWLNIAIGSVILSSLAVTAFFMGAQFGIETARTMAFATLALSQMTNVLTSRTVRMLHTYDFRGNSHLLIGMGLMLVLFLIAVIPMREMLLLATLNGEQWRNVILLSLVPLVLSELTKALMMVLNKYMYIGED